MKVHKHYLQLSPEELVLISRVIDDSTNHSHLAATPEEFHLLIQISQRIDQMLKRTK